MSVAVVGGGIGGAFAAWWLRHDAAHAGLRIDVFEATPRLGGRAFDTSSLHSSNHSGNMVELGASMAIVQNKYMYEATEALGLARRLLSESHGRGLQQMAIIGKSMHPHHNRSFVFEESSWKARTLFRMLRRYGLRNLAKVHQRASDFISNFSRLYVAQEGGLSFDSVDELLSVASMEQWPRVSCEEAMEALVGKDALISDELIAGLTLNNYGQQWAQMGALCCFTAVAPVAAGGSHAAFNVVGGNAGIARGLLSAASAHVHLAHRVTRIGEDGGGYAVHYVDARGDAGKANYDHVILAAPCDAHDSESEGGELNLLSRCDSSVRFQHVFVTLVWGLLSPLYFGEGSRHVGGIQVGEVRDLNLRFADVFTAYDAPVPFNSIGRIDVAQPPGPARAMREQDVAECDLYSTEVIT